MKSFKACIKKIFFGKQAYQRFFEKLLHLSLQGLNIGTGGGSLAETGEEFVIHQALDGESTPVVFDVGAQGGNYTQAVLDISNGKAIVYAFEPSKKSYTPLVSLFRDRVTIENSALGSEIGEATLYHPSSVEGLSSFHVQSDEMVQFEKVRVDTIDSYCEKRGIKGITLLKLDVEGNELPCLKGAERMLPHIKYIQFEMSSRSRESRTYFRDIFDYLHEYQIYRVLRDGLVEISKPDKLSEILFTTNYFAKRR